MVLAIINPKGGSGKTTTAVNLAVALAFKRRKTILIDLDTSANASQILGIKPIFLAPSLANIITSGCSFATVIRRTAINNLDLVTGAPDLANAESILKNIPRRERYLKEAISEIGDKYDYIILDCPPALSILTINSAITADTIIIPIQPFNEDIKALAGLMDKLEKICNNEKAKCRLLLIKTNHFRNNIQNVIKMIRRKFKNNVFKTEIDGYARLWEAPFSGKTINKSDRLSSYADFHPDSNLAASSPKSFFFHFRFSHDFTIANHYC